MSLSYGGHDGKLNALQVIKNSSTGIYLTSTWICAVAHPVPHAKFGFHSAPQHIKYTYRSTWKSKQGYSDFLAIL
jgi:hypothetical protein